MVTFRPVTFWMTRARIGTRGTWEQDIIFTKNQIYSKYIFKYIQNIWPKACRPCRCSDPVWKYKIIKNSPVHSNNQGYFNWTLGRIPLFTIILTWWLVWSHRVGQTRQGTLWRRGGRSWTCWCCCPLRSCWTTPLSGSSSPPPPPTHNLIRFSLQIRMNFD